MIFLGDEDYKTLKEESADDVETINSRRTGSRHEGIVWSTGIVHWQNRHGLERQETKMVPTKDWR